MGKYVSVADTDELKDVNKKKLTVEGQEILLAKVDITYYAVANRCPHLGGSLAAGKLEGNIITCPLHGSQFDITDGKNIRWLKGSGIPAVRNLSMKAPVLMRLAISVLPEPANMCATN